MCGNAENEEAMFHLGEMYEQDSASDDKPKAKSWFEQQSLEMYRKATELGSADAKKWMDAHGRKRRVSQSGEPENMIQTQDPSITVATDIDPAKVQRQYREWVQSNTETSDE